MKDFIYLTIISLLVLFISVHFYMDAVKSGLKETKFIWNDDHESIPKDHTPILLEFTKGDTIYIGPLDEENIYLDVIRKQHYE